MVDHARAAEVESSQILVGRVVPTGSHHKRLVEQVQFHAPCSTRCRPVRSVEHPIYNVKVVHAQDVRDPVVETYATHITDKMVIDEVADEMVQSDVVVVDPVV